MEALDSVFYTFGDSVTENVKYGAEFASVPTEGQSITPEPGQFYSYQNQLMMAAQFIRKAVCIYQPGTGKTRTYIDVADRLRFRKLSQNSYVDQYVSTGKLSIRKVIILTANPKLVENTYRELRDYYADRRYKDDVLDGSYYQVNTSWKFAAKYRAILERDFAGNIEGFKAKMRDEFSNTLFIFDESNKIAGENIGGIQTDIEFSFTEDDQQVEKGDKNLFAKIYEMIHLICHAGDGVVRMAFTGTPMVNNVAEHATTFNLILDLDEQISLSSDFASWTKVEFDRYFNDKIFYIEQAKEDAEIRYYGSDIPGLPLKFLRTPIVKGSIQEKAYIHIAQQKGRKEGVGKNRLYAATMVYSETSAQPAKTVMNDKGEYLDEEFDQEFLREIRKDSDLKDYAIKEWQTRQIIRKHPGMKIGRYDAFVKESGVKAAKINLLSIGFSEYIAKELQIDARGSIHGDKKQRFVYVGNMSQFDYETTMRIWESPDNVYGEYIRVFLGCPAIKVGISVLETEVIIISSPLWNLAAYIQAMNRFIRVGGFKNTMAVKKLEKIIVHVYAFMATFEREDDDWGNLPAPTINGEIMTFDENVIQLAAEKQPLMDKYLFEMVMRSVTGSLNAKRNTAFGIEYDPLVGPDELYYNVLDNLYIDDYVALVVKYILAYMQTCPEISIHTLIADLRKYNYPLVVYERAIYKIVEGRMTVRNRFGFTKYVSWDRGMIYTSDDYPTENSDYFDSYYSSLLTVTMEKEPEYTYQISTTDIETLLSFGDNMNEIRNYLIKTHSTYNAKKILLPSNQFQQAVLEEAVKKYYIEGDERYKHLVEYYSFYIYQQEINGETIYYHTYQFLPELKGASHTTISYIYNPRTFRYFRNGKWHLANKGDTYYDEMKREFTSEIDTRVSERLRGGVKPPIVIWTMIDNGIRVARDKEGCKTSGCTGEIVKTKNKKDQRFELRGRLCHDVGPNDLLTALYQLDPNNAPPGGFLSEEGIFERGLDKLLTMYYPEMSDDGTPLENFAKFTVDSNIPDDEYDAFELYVYNRMHDFRPADAIPPLEDLVDDFYNEGSPIPSEYLSKNYTIRRVASSGLYKGTRGVGIEGVALITKPARNATEAEKKQYQIDIIEQTRYLKFIYSWYTYLGESTTTTKLCELVRESAKRVGKFLVV